MARRFLVLLVGSFLFCSSVRAATWLIKPDGSGDAPTIQAGIDSAAFGDTVLLADGTYMGDGNRDIDYSGKPVVVRAEGEEPEACIVDGGGSHRGFVFENGEDHSSVLDGITIQNAWGTFGGGIRCFMASPTIRHCRLSGNSADRGGGILLASSSSILTDCTFSVNSANDGGAMLMTASSAGIVHCTFEGNRADIDGGAIYCEEPSSPTFTECIFSTNDAASCGGAVCFEYAGATMSECEFIGNSALDGGAIYFGIGEAYYHLEGSIFSENIAAIGGALNCQHGASVSTDRCTLYGNQARSGSGVYFFDTCLPSTLDDSIIAFGKTGSAVWCATAGSLPLLTCCDVYGNQGGDWVGCIEGQQGLNGNIREDPLFCDPSNGDFQLDCSSPCKDGYGCGRIGACGVGCGASVLLPTTWSAIKSIYR